MKTLGAAALAFALLALAPAAGANQDRPPKFTVEIVSWWDHDSHPGNGSAADPHHSGICFKVFTTPDQGQRAGGQSDAATIKVEGNGVIKSRRLTQALDGAGTTTFRVGISITQPTHYEASVVVHGDRGTDAATAHDDLYVVRGPDPDAHGRSCRT